MRTLIVLVLIAAAAAALVMLAGVERSPERSPQEAERAIEGALTPAAEYGTRPELSVTPARAVDTDELPNVIIDPQASDQDPLPYYRIAPDTYLVYGNVAVLDRNNRGFNANAGFVVTPEGVVVIDALGTPKLGRRLIATIRSATEIPISHLILTHNHPDHAYGASAFRELEGVSILAHEGMLDYLGSSTFQESVAYRRKLVPEDMEGFEAVRPDRLIGGERFTRYKLTVGGRRFDIYNVGEHHSHGDLVVHQVDQDVLWISDLAFNNRLTYMADGHSEQILEAQDWLLRNFSGAALMVPGHGSAQTPPFPMVAETRAYVKRLREEMAAAIDAGMGLNEAVQRARFPEWEDVPLYGHNQRANAHFVYLEMEQALF